MPVRKISRPMPMRMIPPRTEAFPASLVPNFLPMCRPAMQIKKVQQDEGVQLDSLLDVLFLHSVRADEHVQLLALDALHQHLSADVGQ